MTEKPNKELADRIRKIMVGQMEKNDDGFALFDTKTGESLRTLNPQEMKAKIEKTDIDGTIFHARLASVGEVSADNVHCYEDRGFVFAHNGGISDYAQKSNWVNGSYTTSARAQQDTDSYLFFLDLVDEIEARNATGHKEIAKAIQAMLNEIVFWGRASLYHKESDRLFLFGDWHTYTMANDYLIVSSADLGKPKIDHTLKIRGFRFETYPQTEYLTGTLDGIAVIKKYSTPNWSLKYLLDKDYSIKKVCNTTREYKYQTPVNVSQALPAGEELPNARDEQDDEYYRQDYMFDLNGDYVEVYEDETGTHDTLQTCCQIGTCDYFFDTPEEAQETREQFFMDEYADDLPQLEFNNCRLGFDLDTIETMSDQEKKQQLDKLMA